MAKDRYGFSAPVHAVFFDGRDDDLDYQPLGQPVPDHLAPEHIMVDRDGGGDVVSGCWVRNWRLFGERGLVLGE